MFLSSSSSILPANPLTPTAIPGGSSAEETSLRPVQIQVRGNIEDNLRPMKISTNISRRDLAFGLASAASLAIASLSIPETAEARVVKPETRKKIFEKLKMLREKAGLSKPKAENGEKTSPPSPSAEELKLLPPLPLPNLRNSSGNSLIEATLP